MLLTSKKREKEEEESDLNITSLMDTFTIVLVFLIQQYGTSVVDVSANYRPPTALTRIAVQRVLAVQVRPVGPDAIAYVIGQHQQKFERKNANLGYQQLLADLRSEKKLVDALITDNTKKGEINIVCDKTLPYSMLMDVMRSVAGAGFYKLQLVTQA